MLATASDSDNFHSSDFHSSDSDNFHSAEELRVASDARARDFFPKMTSRDDGAYAPETFDIATPNLRLDHPLDESPPITPPPAAFPLTPIHGAPPATSEPVELSVDLALEGPAFSLEHVRATAEAGHYAGSAEAGDVVGIPDATWSDGVDGAGDADGGGDGPPLWTDPSGIGTVETSWALAGPAGPDASGPDGGAAAPPSGPLASGSPAGAASITASMELVNSLRQARRRRDLSSRREQVGGVVEQDESYDDRMRNGTGAVEEDIILDSTDPAMSASLSLGRRGVVEGVRQKTDGSKQVRPAGLEESDPRGGPPSSADAGPERAGGGEPIWADPSGMGALDAVEKTSINPPPPHAEKNEFVGQNLFVPTGPSSGGQSMPLARSSAADDPIVEQLEEEGELQPLSVPVGKDEGSVVVGDGVPFNGGAATIGAPPGGSAFMMSGSSPRSSLFPRRENPYRRERDKNAVDAMLDALWVKQEGTEDAGGEHFLVQEGRPANRRQGPLCCRTRAPPKASSCRTPCCPT